MSGDYGTATVLGHCTYSTSSSAPLAAARAMAQQELLILVAVVVAQVKTRLSGVLAVLAL
jgi:hypothetical protein